MRCVVCLSGGLTAPDSCKEKIDGINVDIPVKDRVEKLAVLRRTPACNKKIAVLLYPYTGESDGIGGAFGLDSPASVIEILKKLKDAGYKVDHIPKTGNEVIEELITGLNNDQNWLSPEEMEKRAAGEVSGDVYSGWFSDLPEEPAEKICRDWGQPPGELFVNSRKSIMIPGVKNGNVFIGIQPPRGFFEQIETMYHSVDLVMPHHYLAYYRWLKHDFGVHAVIHLGTHGTLEWLPGKSVGLSENCYPDIVLDDLPHFYPYIIDNPGEGTQAKRRSTAAILDHLIPAMMRADGYGEVADLDVTVKNQVSRELDILDHDDDYAYLGGMNACAKAYGGKDPLSVIGDASDPDMVRTKSIDEEIRYLFRSRVLNPKWLEGLKPHGYRGVQELVANVEYTFGWDATSDVVDDWEYQELAEHYLFDEETRKWIEENNPHALRNMAGRLLEACERGLWNADDETVQRLKELYLESEDILEELTE